MTSTLLPRFDIEQLVSWGPSTQISVHGVSLPIAHSLRAAISRSTDVSPLFNTAWLYEAHKRVAWTLKGLPTAPKSYGVQHAAEHLELVERVLADLMALPTRFPTTLSMDIIFEIFQWTALAHQDPLSLTLISSTIQRWVDPFVFSSCKFYERGPEDFPFLSESSKTLTPRFSRLAPFIEKINLGCEGPEDILEIIRLHFPSLRSLIIPAPYTAIEPTEVPSLTRLYCPEITTFANPPANLDIANPLFRGLISLSISIAECNPTTIRSWNWSDLATFARLSELVLIVDAMDPDELSDILTIIKDSILNALPDGFQMLVVRLVMDHMFSGGPEYWPMQELQHIADGSWDLRTVLIVTEDVEDEIRQVLRFSFDEYEITSDSAMAAAKSIVDSRQNVPM